MKEISKHHFLEILNGGIPNRENPSWLQAVVSENDNVQNVVKVSCDLFAANRGRAAHQSRMNDQWRELKSLPVLLGCLAGVGIGGALAYYRLPYVGSVVALAGPLFVVGGVARVVISMRARDAAREKADRLQKELAEELKRIRALLPDKIVTGGYDFVPPGSVSLKLEMKRPGAPSIWSSAHPYIRRTSEFLTLVSFVGACLEVAGYSQMGKIVDFTRIMGLCGIFASTAMNGLYDTETGGKERMVRAVLFAAFISIIGCRAVQQFTGVTFGDYQFVWNMISKGQYYGYLLWLEGRAAYTLWKAATKSTQLGELVGKASEQKLEASLIAKSDDAEYREKHLALARYVATRAKKRQSEADTIRGLVDLIRPALEIFGLIAVIGPAHNLLRVTEGALGLWVIWLARQQQKEIEKETIDYIRSNDRIDRYFTPKEIMEKMRGRGLEFESIGDQFTDEEILRRHLLCLNEESMKGVATLVELEERRQQE